MLLIRFQANLISVVRIDQDRVGQGFETQPVDRVRGV
jgi:hypothetical protein